jgi:hypothetical protein
MNQKKQAGLSPLQFSILEALYFLEPFQRLEAEIAATRTMLKVELKAMITKGWAQVMAADPASGEYMPTLTWDSDHIENYAFVVTREGLLKHTTL